VLLAPELEVRLTVVIATTGADASSE